MTKAIVRTSNADVVIIEHTFAPVVRKLDAAVTAMRIHDFAKAMQILKDVKIGIGIEIGD